MATNPFNPAAFQKKEGEEKKKTVEKLPYPVTGNSTRDQIRKMLWEIFTSNELEAKSLPDEKHSCEDLVSKIEEEIHESTGTDSKSRQYRDKVKQIQLKIKGPRFKDTRNDLRLAKLEVQELCSEAYLTGKGSGVSGAGRSGPPGAPPGRGRGGPSGPPGAMGRGRGVPPPGLGRGRG